ncbi:MAG TPA: phage tail protein [Solirubrobacteraceae bacterium]|nr:phage tail protein [Solirubrobacteraceae bacterium]
MNTVTDTFDAKAALVSAAFAPGDVKLSAAQSPPDGWLHCDGSAVSRATYADLFEAISVAYGAGDASTTFKRP